MKLGLCLRVASLSFLVAVTASAAVINSAPIGGLTTFQDTNTGRIWAGMNNFFNESYLDMKVDVESQGFIVADLAAVQQLLNSLPLSGGQWTGYAAIMGSAPNRDLIWGAYLPETTTQSWAWSYLTDSAWQYWSGTGVPLSDVPNAETPDADMNIWAYYDGAAAVPEPSTLALVASAGLALLALRRRR